MYSIYGNKINIAHNAPQSNGSEVFFFACSRDYYYAQTGFCFLFALVFPVLIRNKFLFLFSLPCALFVNR